MADQPAKRALTTIFYADEVDYSRLTGLDEEGTHNRVRETLDNVSQKISSSGGKVLRYAGDAILATFPGIAQAVKTSTNIQAKLSQEAGDQGSLYRVSRSGLPRQRPRCLRFHKRRSGP